MERGSHASHPSRQHFFSFFFSFFLSFYFFIFLYLNDSRRLAQGTFKMKRFNADVMYVVRVDVLCMCYVSEYVRVIIILMGGRPISLSGILTFFQLLFPLFFFFFHFVSFGLLSFSIVICDRISTCIIQYSYINRATPTGLRLEHPSTLFLLLLLRVNSLSAFSVTWLSKSRRFRICVYRVFVFVSRVYLNI